jgi:hypothetical protein
MSLWRSVFLSPSSLLALGLTILYKDDPYPLSYVSDHLRAVPAAEVVVCVTVSSALAKRAGERRGRSSSG